MAEAKLHIPVNMPLLLFFALRATLKRVGRNSGRQQRDRECGRADLAQDGEVVSHVCLSLGQGVVNFAWPDLPAAVFTMTVIAAPEGMGAGACPPSAFPEAAS